MPRPRKDRRVEYMPRVRLFKPAGVRAADLRTYFLTVEELEAMRLKDMEGLDQSAAAERMDVSRPTFARILGSARSKVATALFEGMAIQVEGGHFRLAGRPFECTECGSRFEVPYRRGRGRRFPVCPECGEFGTRPIGPPRGRLPHGPKGPPGARGPGQL